MGTAFASYPISVAFFDLRKALDAYLRGEELPTPEFPSSEELVAIVQGHAIPPSSGSATTCGNSS